MRWKINELGTLGLRSSGTCAVHFWLGWLAWSIAGFSALWAAFHLRVPDPPAGYVVEAALGILWPFLALAYADHVTISAYHRVSFSLAQPGFAPALLDLGLAEYIREELRSNWLLRWFRPPVTATVAGQIMAITLWYSAAARHPGEGFWARYGEWIVDVLGGYAMLAGTAGGAILWLNGAGEDLPWLLYAMLLGVSLALAVLGHSAIRFGARHQAVLDYFRNWRLDSYQPGPAYPGD